MYSKYYKTYIIIKLLNRNTQRKHTTRKHNAPKAGQNANKIGPRMPTKKGRLIGPRMLTPSGPRTK